MSKHLPPAPTLEESVQCPLLDHDTEAWIRCCTARFLSLARRVAGDDARRAAGELDHRAAEALAVPG